MPKLSAAARHNRWLYVVFLSNTLKGELMLKSIIEKKIRSFEDSYDYRMDYARRVLELGAPVLKRFQEATRLGAYDGGLRPSVHRAAGLIAIVAGDCGPCVQLTVKLAEEAGMPQRELIALLERRFDDLPEDVELSARFADALLRRSEELPELRERVLQRFGVAGQVAIAYAVITSSMYPVLKYALGFGEACNSVYVGDKLVSAKHRPDARGVFDAA